MSRGQEIVNYLGMSAVVASDRMWDLLARTERIARTNAAVLISGESGAGKELIARAIHHFSIRSSKPWVDVSCGTLPEHLMESELFGHEKGAFSGADQLKQGLFELAHTGTLYLDEIAELDPRMQVKLLRVLDGVPYYRLGGVRKVVVDVRIVVATNQYLEEATRAGRFRNDLFHRLNQIRIHVPPLRERPGDIVPIAEFFLKQQSPLSTFSPGALEVLGKYGWPGNIRELRNVVTKASLAAKDSQIGIQDLPPEVSARCADVAELEGGLDEMERRMILAVLNRTGGRREKAAEVLGISRRTLSRKLKLYGADVPAETCAS